jgi:hypothetical protein
LIFIYLLIFIILILLLKENFNCIHLNSQFQYHENVHLYSEEQRDLGPGWWGELMTRLESHDGKKNGCFWAAECPAPSLTHQTGLIT